MSENTHVAEQGSKEKDIKSAIGLSETVLKVVDFDLALKRVRSDTFTDFIYAPHFNAVFQHASDDLVSALKERWRSGRHEPHLPLTIEVPKPSGFSRPGSILWPLDRLAYQALVDTIASKADAELDRASVYSNVLMDEDPEGVMFRSAHECYSDFRSRLEKLCTASGNEFVLRADVSSFFERIYQHVLVNLLRSANCDAGAVNALEKLLFAFTQHDSHGIIQGVFPSDFLGNLYLASVDGEHSMTGIPFIRYVDDMYFFFSERKVAEEHKTILCKLLRRDGLSLNEAKTKVYRSEGLLLEESVLDRLFDDARKEISETFEKSDFYGSTTSWDHDEDEDESEVGDKDVLATIALFHDEVRGDMRDKVDRFCLPVLAAAKVGVAIDHVFKRYVEAPHMAQVYAKYMRSMMRDVAGCRERVEGLLLSGDVRLDYPLMWLLASLGASSKVSGKVLELAFKLLKAGERSECVRAIGALVVAKYGSGAQRRMLRNHYGVEQSPYVKAAIVYGARHFSSDERRACYGAWGGHNEANVLIMRAVKGMHARG